MSRGAHLSIADIVRKRRLFILGAGFSTGAGIPMTAPLLSQAMKLFREESPGLWPRVDGYVRACFGLENEPRYDQLNLAEICTFLHYVELREHAGGERWSEFGSRENLAIRYFIAKAVAQCTPTGSAIPDIYLRFAKQLHEGDVVISFNWDCLLEAALAQVGRPYSHAFEENAVPLAKLHGSIDWRLGLPTKASLSWHPVGFDDGLTQMKIYSCSDLRSVGAWNDADQGPLGEIQPLIVLPGYGKGFDVRRLAGLWYKPEFAFGLTHDVFIVGLSLARDDFIVRSMFLHNLPSLMEMSGVPGRSVYIVNPDPVARDNYAFLLGLPFVRFLCEPFGDAHLAVMERCLS
jgi:hypothetical protein